MKLPRRAWLLPGLARRILALLDVDGDGDLDLVVGQTDRSVVIWRNIGAGRFQRVGR